MPIRSFNIPFPRTPKYMHSEIYVTCFAMLSSVLRWQIAKKLCSFPGVYLHRSIEDLRDVPWERGNGTLFQDSFNALHFNKLGSWR